MQYRRLGKSGIKLSAIGLGSYLTLGQSVSESATADIVTKAYEAGVNFFDTANAYGRGAAEIALGQSLANLRRDSFVLASKVWAPMGDGPNDRGLSRKHIFEQCHASLGRLRTDYLDLYQCHRYDPETPVLETARAMHDLIAQGKVLYWGVSEWNVQQMVELISICQQFGLVRPVSNQPRYSLLWRHPERSVFPFCEAQGIGQIVFSPLAHGMLSGKYRPGQPPPAGTRAADPAKNQIMMQHYFTAEKVARVAKMSQLAEANGARTSQLALAWILRRSEVSSIITGATSLAQLNENLGAIEIKIDGEMARALEELFPVASELEQMA